MRSRTLIAAALAAALNPDVQISRGPCRCGAHDCPDREREYEHMDFTPENPSDRERVEAAKAKRARKAARWAKEMK